MKKYFFYFYVLLLIITHTCYAKSRNTQTVSDSILSEIEKNCFSNKKKSNVLLEELYKLSENQQGSIQNTIQYMYAQMMIAYAQGVNASDLVKDLNACLDTLNPQRDPFSSTLLQYTLALGYVSQDDYAKAFTMARLFLLEMRSMSQYLISR